MYTLLSAPAAAPTYTPVGGVLNATAFAEWLVANAQTASKLILAPGEYLVPTPATSGTAHLELTDELSDIVIEMSGVTLIQENRVTTALRASNWRNVTLSGLTITYAELPTNRETGGSEPTCLKPHPLE